MERSDDSISPLIGNEHFVGNKRGRYWKLRVGCLVVVLFFAGFCRGLLKSDEDSVIGEESLNEPIIIDTSTKEQKIIKDPTQRVDDFPPQAPPAPEIPRSNKDWDLLGITVNWPETSCRQMNRTHHICHESADLDNWTIHGLWPNRADGSWPQYCTDEKFNPDSVKDLLPPLEKHWPNLMSDRPKYDFWTHEYEKHGTCAQSLEALSTQEKYFKKTLNIWQDMNILDRLDNFAYPSHDRTYNITDFIDGFHKVTDGHYCEIKCADGHLDGSFNSEKQLQFIIEVMCCMDKEFNFVDCPKTAHFDEEGSINPLAYYQQDYPNVLVHACRADIPISYPLISHL